MKRALLMVKCTSHQDKITTQRQTGKGRKKTVFPLTVVFRVL